MPRLHRDGVLFLAGLGAFIHEVVIHAGPERPTLILASLALMGLPIWLRADEAKQGRRDG